MSIQIKQLGGGTISVTTADQPLLNTNPVAEGKAILVKSIRLVNKNTTNPVTINLNAYVGPTPSNRRIAPVDLTLAPKAMYVDNDEITLEAGHKLLITLSGTSPSVDYVVSGAERDVV